MSGQDFSSLIYELLSAITRDGVVAVLSWAWIVYIAIVSVWIVLQKRSPVATLG